MVEDERKKKKKVRGGGGRQKYDRRKNSESLSPGVIALSKQGRVCFRRADD